MNYLLDTCLLSEFTRRQPEQKVIRWLDSIDEEKLFVCVITVGEIQHGIERLSESRRKVELLTWLNNRLIDRFSARILPLDTSTMILWGSLMARMEKSGQPIAVMDALIAASATQNNLIIATRNISDFLPCGVPLINPWE
jgi:predicted nucleic acid-binding protein